MATIRLVGSLKLQVSFAKEPYKSDYILQKRPIIAFKSTRRAEDTRECVAVCCSVLQCTRTREYTREYTDSTRENGSTRNLCSDDCNLCSDDCNLRSSS